MSEEQQNQETTQEVVNNELTDRVNSAYIAEACVLLNGGTDNMVMISAEKDGEKVDVLATLESLDETIGQLKKEIEEYNAKK